jgi:FkbM family methyltransferase
MDKSQPLHKALRHFIGEHSRVLTQHFTYTTKSGIAKGLKRRGGFGFISRDVTDEERFYWSLKLNGKVVYDIGSNEGIFSLFCAREIGKSGVLIAFEPNPISFARTVQNLQLNNFECQTQTLNVALGNERRTASMWCPSGETARSTLNQQLAHLYEEQKERCSSFEVQIERLDDLVASGLPAPDFMKIDTEGHEAEVLLGAAETLRSRQPEIFVELHGTTPQNWQDNRLRVQLFLESCGYKIFDMHHKELVVTRPASHLYGQPRAGKRESKVSSGEAYSTQ